MWFPVGTVFLITPLTIKPYQKAYMNYLDTLLLSNLALCCYVMTSEIHVLLITRIILFLTPIAIFILTTLVRKFCKVSKSHNFKALSHKCYNCYRLRALFMTKPMQPRFTADIQAIGEEQLPFIQPTCMEISYGTNVNGPITVN